ncbi:MAG: pilus assembly FimT family protein [Planctomycetota bacterium]|jgi:Tfp pilus assembly protein FimT
MAQKRTAYSLVELIVVVIFLGILAAVAVPRLKFTAVSKYKAEATAKKIVTNLRRTRGLAIANAATNTDGFKLQMSGSAPYTGYEIVNLNTLTTVLNGTFSIDSAISCTGDNDFEFGPLGNLTGTDTQLIVSAEGKTFTITIVPATGMIKCVEN